MPTVNFVPTKKLRPLSKELQKKAECELNEDPSRIEEDLQHLREWLKKQPHLTARQDDHFLLCFLRGCKFSVQRAKAKLDYFHTVKSMLPEYFTNRDPFSPGIQELLKVGAILPLPQTNGLTGPRIIFVRWSVCNPTIVSYQLLIKLVYMIIDILMQEDDNFVVSGFQFLVDYKDFPTSFLLQLTPVALHKSALAVQSAYPLRMKRMDLINLPSICDAIFSFLLSVLNQKLKDRTASYSESAISNLYKYVPQELLPKEYGGAGESLKATTDIWKNKVESYSQWFEEDTKYCSNERLRPDVDDSNCDIVGINGTFRKLNID